MAFKTSNPGCPCCGTPTPGTCCVTVWKCTTKCVQTLPSITCQTAFVAGATVTWTRSGGGAGPFTATSDGSGNACITTPPAGTYTVSTTVGAVTKSLTLTSDGSACTGGTILLVNDTLCVHVVSSCRLVSGVAAPIAGAVVTVTGHGSATTGSDGWACIPFTSTPGPTVSGTVALSTGPVDTFTASSDACGIEVSFYDYVCICVKGCFGLPLINASVGLAYLGNPALTGTTDSAGTFCGYTSTLLKPDVSGSDYTVTVTSDGMDALTSHAWGPCSNCATSGAYLQMTVDSSHYCCECAWPMPKTLTLTDANGSHTAAVAGVPSVPELCYLMANPSSCVPASGACLASGTTPIFYNLRCISYSGGNATYQLLLVILGDPNCPGPGGYGSSAALQCGPCAAFGPTTPNATSVTANCTVSCNDPLDLVFALPSTINVNTTFGGAMPVPNPVGTTVTITP